MKSNLDERDVRLCADYLEQKLLLFVEIVGSDHTFSDLENLFASGPLPNFDSEDEVAAFYTQILRNARERNEHILSTEVSTSFTRKLHFQNPERTKVPSIARPPFNAEYVLYLFLRKEERDMFIGDVIEEYGKILERFTKRRADIWFYKQVGGSLFPLVRRTLFKIGTFVWLGRILRRLIS
jgi:hypothetical protein